MKVIDKTIEYIAHILKENNPVVYEESYPALFDHYYRFWGKEGKPFISLTEEEVVKRSSLILKELFDIERSFEDFGLKISDLELVLFVGQDTSNGHAFRDGEKMVVWIPVESYKTRLLVRVFVTHEIAHALHYRRSPRFYTEDPDDMRKLSRELVTEGLATYLTAEILAVDRLTALWADFLAPEKAKSWLNECEKRKRELLEYIFKNFESESSGTGLFLANDPNNILQYRAGYFAGFEVIEGIIKSNKIDPVDLLSISREKMERMVYSYLKENYRAE